MRVLFSGHAVKRMFERQIGRAEVEEVLSEGIAIEARGSDKPYPSRLLLGFPRGRPLHVLVSENRDADEMTIVTLYEPDPALWSDDFRRRRKS